MKGCFQIAECSLSSAKITKIFNNHAVLNKKILILFNTSKELNKISHKTAFYAFVAEFSLYLQF